jgi:hypothetical protein
MIRKMVLLFPISALGGQNDAENGSAAVVVLREKKDA